MSGHHTADARSLLIAHGKPRVNRELVVRVARRLEEATYLGGLEDVGREIAAAGLRAADLNDLRLMYDACRAELHAEFEGDFRRRCPELAALQDRVEAFVGGFIFGGAVLYEVGRRAGVDEEITDWNRRMGVYRGVLARPPMDELRRRRGRVTV